MYFRGYSYDDLLVQLCSLASTTMEAFFPFHTTAYFLVPGSMFLTTNPFIFS